jgi:hypothetical protein
LRRALRFRDILARGIHAPITLSFNRRPLESWTAPIRISLTWHESSGFTRALLTKQAVIAFVPKILRDYLLDILLHASPLLLEIADENISAIRACHLLVLAIVARL